MSYFPSDHFLPSSNSTVSTPVCFEPSSSAHGQEEWTTVTSASTYPFVTPPPRSFKTDDTFGLGLLQTTASTYAHFGPQHDQSMATGLQFQWPSQFSAPQIPTWRPQQFLGPAWDDTNIVPLQRCRSDSHCIQPRALQAGFPIGTTPALSDYSPSSFPSAASTPYARSDSAVQILQSSPMKIETETLSPVPSVKYCPEPATPTPALFVYPGDLTARPTTAFQQEQLEASIASQPVSDIVEIKPDPEQAPTTGRRRAASTNTLHPEEAADRKKRAYTNADKATCSCLQCGKLFQRTYNLRAHMETHDPMRVQPHECLMDGCERRFVRRTDLLRHQSSVHLKARDHFCPRCGGSFARKDTLRRHVEDGCVRRLEVRRRNLKGRRASSASLIKHSPRCKGEQLAADEFRWEDIPEFR